MPLTPVATAALRRSAPSAASITSPSGPAALVAAAAAAAAAPLPVPPVPGRLTLHQPRPFSAWSTPRPRHRYRANAHAAFSTSTSRHAKNQVFSPRPLSRIRNNDTFQTHLALSSSSRTPLLTLWTASWCPTCRNVEPLIRSLVESGVGEPQGGVAFAPVEFDSPDIMSAGAEGLAMTYMITSIPTLLSFDAGEAQTTTKMTDARRLADKDFLTQWIQNEARRHGGRGGGGSSGLSFGGLFRPST
ncbi:Thioredoxin-like protein [Cordyceps militaris]|uniref:Thioredoxin-like protein n=1 Tax=Cordyceps militaris TaxID=73501 RepID=A0A2H4SBX8_CORMI|nr:Thioredoxin-like protein [Cordyceps militaris]